MHMFLHNYYTCWSFWLTIVIFYSSLNVFKGETVVDINLQWFSSLFTQNFITVNEILMIVAKIENVEFFYFK